MKKINLPLIVGIFIIVCLLMVVSFEEKLATVDPQAQNIGGFEVVDGEMTYDKAPYEPNDVYLWGSDILGRDVYSRLIYGTRITLTIALMSTLIKFGISLPFAFLGGFRGKFYSKIISVFHTVFSGMPALLWAIFILKLPFANHLEIEYSIVFFACVLGIIEWGRVGKILEEKVKDILNQGFIIGEIAIGKNSLRIATTNVMPHLMPSLVVLFFLEMSRSLIFLAQLGVFSVFIGSMVFDTGMFSDIGMLGLSFTPEFYPEWGSMLASSRYAIYSGKFWLVFPVVSAFFISVLGFNLFGEGLKREIEKRQKFAFLRLKWIVEYISPITLYNEVKNYKKFRGTLSFKFGVVLLAIILLYKPVPNSEFYISNEMLNSHLSEMNEEQYNGRLVGSEGNKLARDYIINQLETLNIKPYFDDSFIMEYDMTSVADISDSYMLLRDPITKQESRFEYRNDYVFKNYTLNTEFESGIIIVAEENDDEYYLDYAIDQKRYFVSLNPKINYMIDKLASISYSWLNPDATDKFYGIFYTDGQYKLDEKNTVFSKALTEFENNERDGNLMGYPLVVMNDEFADFFKGKNGYEIEIHKTINKTDEIGRNIGGILKGSNSELPPIILSSSYDYLGNEEKFEANGLFANGTSIATILELARVLSTEDKQFERDIIFMFYDGSILEKNKDPGVKKFALSKIHKKNKGAIPIILDHLGYDEKNRLYIDTTSFGLDESNKWQYVKYLKSRGNQLDVEIANINFVESVENYYEYLKESSGIIIKSVDSRAVERLEKKEIIDEDYINRKNLASQSQLILDLIIYIQNMEANYVE